MFKRFLERKPRMVNRIVLTAILVLGCLWCWLSVGSAQSRAVAPALDVQVARADPGMVGRYLGDHRYINCTSPGRSHDGQFRLIKLIDAPLRCTLGACA